MASIDYDALDASLGAYNRANHAMLFKQAFYGGESANNMSVIPNVKDQKPLVVPSIGALSQTGVHTAFNPTTDALTFGNRILQVRPAKVDLQVIPSEMWDKYLGVLFTSGADPYSFPFEAFLMEYIMKQVGQDQENIRWNGVYVDGSAAGAGAVNTTAIADGFKHKIADEITATNLTAVATGAITSSNAVASLEAMWLALDDKYKVPGAKMYMSHTIAHYYALDYRTKFGDVNYNAGFEKRTLELSGGKCEIVPTTALAGSGRVILDPVGLMTVGTDLLGDANKIIVEREKRALNIMVDYLVGVEFAALSIGGIEVLKVNDQA